MRKWNFFKWTRDNQKRFADEVAEELDSKMPANGGTITGPITIDLPANKQGTEYPLVFKAKYLETDTGYTWKIGICAIGPLAYIANNSTHLVGISPSLGLFPANSNNKAFTLGYYNSHWPNVYADKLNNGEDIEIPTKGGTMALVSDIEDILRKHGLIPPETTEPTEQPKGE